MDVTVAFGNHRITKIGAHNKEKSDVKLEDWEEGGDRSFGNMVTTSLSQQRCSGDYHGMNFPAQCQEVRFPHYNDKYFQW